MNRSHFFNALLLAMNRSRSGRPYIRKYYRISYRYRDQFIAENRSSKTNSAHPGQGL